MESAGPHVLLIDDDPDMHDAVRMMLEPLGYRVSGYLTGPEGLAALRAQRPAAVLLDVMLASPTEGFEIAREIRSDPDLCGVRIIMISAIGAQLGQDFADQLGSHYEPADVFLEKPIDAADLRDAVQRVLSDAERPS